jgi:hypothetical protein
MHRAGVLSIHRQESTNLWTSGHGSAGTRILDTADNNVYKNSLSIKLADSINAIKILIDHAWFPHLSEPARRMPVTHGVLAEYRRREFLLSAMYPFDDH